MEEKLCVNCCLCLKMRWILTFYENKNYITNFGYLRNCLKSDGFVAVMRGEVIALLTIVTSVVVSICYFFLVGFCGRINKACPMGVIIVCVLSQYNLTTSFQSIFMYILGEVL